MRIILLFLTIALYSSLGAQIVFEEVTPVPGTFIRHIDESSTSLQSLLTSEALFGKTLSGSIWIQMDQEVTDIYDVK